MTTIDKTKLTKQQLKRLEQWTEIRRILANADKRKRDYAKDLRTDYPAGELGDAQFLTFVTDVMGEKHEVARQLLTLALLTRLIPNDREYERVIGVDQPKQRTASLNVGTLSKLSTKQQEDMVQKHKRGGANDLRCALNKLFRSERKPMTRTVTPYQVAKLLDEHWDALEATGIPLKQLAEFIGAYLNKDAKSEPTKAA